MDFPFIFGPNYIFGDYFNAEIDMENHIPFVFNHRRCPWELRDKQFVKLFRLTKPVARELLYELEPRFPHNNRRSAIPSDIRMLTALNFLASGSYQHSVGEGRTISLSQPSVSRCLMSVCDALQPILGNYIKFPKDELTRDAVKLSYWEKHGFPGTIGAVDGTHIAILPPPRNDPVHPEQDYINRKRFHSINTQVIADSDRRILSIWPKFPGRTHDAYIWYRSESRRYLHQLYDDGLRNTWLLGDSAYGLENILLKPFLNAQPGTPRSRYNAAFRSARSSVECAIGTLKNRWRCLLKARTLHYHPTVAAKIICTCAALHNICINENIPLILNNNENFVDDEFQDNNVLPLYNLPLANRIRDNVVELYFTD